MFKGVSFYKEDDEKMKEIWNKMSNEKMVGVLHAFVLIKPTIDKAMVNSIKVDDAMKFMHQNGFPTHHLANKKHFGNNHQMFIPTDSVPVITKDDATKFLEMEYKASNIQDNLRSMFSKVKGGLDSLGIDPYLEENLDDPENSKKAPKKKLPHCYIPGQENFLGIDQHHQQGWNM